MAMNSLLGKTMAIAMLAGRPIAAIVFFTVGFIGQELKIHRRKLAQ